MRRFLPSFDRRHDQIGPPSIGHALAADFLAFAVGEAHRVRAEQPVVDVTQVAARTRQQVPRFAQSVALHPEAVGREGFACEGATGALVHRPREAAVRRRQRIRRQRMEEPVVSEGAVDPELAELPILHAPDLEAHLTASSPNDPHAPGQAPSWVCDAEREQPRDPNLRGRTDAGVGVRLAGLHWRADPEYPRRRQRDRRARKQPDQSQQRHTQGTAQPVEPRPARSSSSPTRAQRRCARLLRAPFLLARSRHEQAVKLRDPRHAVPSSRSRSTRRPRLTRWRATPFEQRRRAASSS